MNPRATTLALLSFLAVSAHADRVLSDYGVDATDSLAVDQLYGIQTAKNPASTVSASVVGGSVVFKAKYASDRTEGYSANVGLLLPITRDWAELDLTGLTRVTFEYKNSAKITDALTVSIGSGAYPEGMAKAGTVYEHSVTGTAALAAGTTWKTATLDILDFAPPKWWTPTADFPEKALVLKAVKNLQFVPKTQYTAAGSQDGKQCTKCVGPDMDELTLEIKNITLVGVPPNGPIPTNIGCERDWPFVQVDDFLDGDDRSLLGTYWYTYTDSGDYNPADRSKGSSRATKAVDGSKGYIQLDASLNKKIAGTWNDYAGWAGLGVRMGSGLDSTIPKLSNLTGISFAMYSDRIGPNVETIQFKVYSEGTSDTATHYKSFPAAAVLKEGGLYACVNPKDLVQPGYLQASHRFALDPAKITKLAWEAQITDKKSPLIDTATVRLLVADVKFHGVDFAGVAQKPQPAGFHLQWEGSRMLLSGTQGIRGFEVRDLRGSVVARFAPAAVVDLNLPRGNYWLVAKRDGGLETKAFSTLR